MATIAERLKGLLGKARERIYNDSATIHALTSSPIILGIVLKVKVLDYNDVFSVGTRVVCVRGEWQGQTGIVKISPQGDTHYQKGAFFTAGNKGAKIGVTFDYQEGQLFEDDVYFAVRDNKGRDLPMSKMDVVPVIARRSYALVSLKGEIVEIALPEHVSVVPGDAVKVRQGMDGLGIVDKADYLPLGEEATFIEMVGDMAKVSHGGNEEIIYTGAQKNMHKGDRLVVDEKCTVILKNLGQSEKAYSYDQVSVTWNQIGGLEKAKAQLQEAIELPVKYESLFRAYGKQPVKGAVLIGPPGNGKTLLAKAAATSIAQLYGRKKSPFLYIKGPEIMSMYVGAAESTLRGIFERARRFYQDEKLPMVIFFDEAETLFPRRGSGISSDARDTIVATFLAEMDGLHDSHCFVLLATNRVELLDPAVTRDGRCGTIIEVDRPTPASAVEILRIHLTGKPLAVGHTAMSLANAIGYACFDSKQKVNGDKLLHQVLSGAMLEGIVQRAVGIAMMRDIKSARKTPSGIKYEDMLGALEQVVAEQSNLNHASFKETQHGHTN